MIRKQDYFRLGAFIIIGTCMLIAIIIVLGAGRYFSKTYTVESYFNESVNGLEIGSPVKLRGVNIGRVSDINFVANKYDEAKTSARYVLVTTEINPQLFNEMDDDEFFKSIDEEVQRGLRVRPTSLGLTGQLFLNFVYTDPTQNLPLPIGWDPDVAYVPSVPSTLGRVESAVTTISKTLSGIRQEDITSIIEDVKSIVDTIDHFMRTEGGREAGNRLLSILTSTDRLISRVNTLMASPETERLIPEVVGAISGVNHIINASSDDLIAASKEARQAMENLNKTSAIISKEIQNQETQQAIAQIGPALKNISKASNDLAAAVAKVHALANRLNSIAASEEGTIHSILEDTREIMQNVKELTGDAKRYPSGVFFGKPPSKATPDTE